MLGDWESEHIQATTITTIATEYNTTIAHTQAQANTTIAHTQAYTRLFLPNLKGLTFMTSMLRLSVNNLAGMSLRKDYVII